MSHSPAAGGATASHEAIYRFIYALPKGELAKHGVMLQSERTARRRQKTAGERTSPIVGMVSINDRDETVADRRVPGRWEGDLVVGAFGRTAVAPLVERTTRFTVILGLPEGKTSVPLADLLIDHANSLPVMMRKSLTWDQGSQMARHAALTLATNMPVYFAHPPPRGNAAPTRTPTASSAVTCPGAPSSPAISPTSTPSPKNSTTGPEQPSTSKPHAKPSND